MSTSLRTRRHGALCTVLLLSVWQAVLAVTVFESVKLSVVGLRDTSIQFTMANFGQVPYGTTLQGEAWYPSEEFDGSGHDCGSLACNFGCEDFLAASPPFQLLQGAARIALLDRVPDVRQSSVQHCTHLEKAVRAAALGASAVVIIDSDDTPNIAITKDAPDLNRLRETLAVPVGMIKASDGEWLRSQMRAMDPAPIKLHLDFLNPVREAPSVKISFWHDTDDSCGERCDVVTSFLAKFAKAERDLETGPGARISFEPHFLFNEAGTDCLGAARMSCAAQCVNGRYCAFDSSPAIGSRLSGATVIEENVRQACIWQVLKETPSHSPTLWWDYALAFRQECKSSENNFNQACSERIFEEHFGPAMLAPWKQCWSALGTEAAIPAVDAEITLSNGSLEGTPKLVLNPTIKLNDQQYRGNLESEPVMRAICAAFKDNEEPEACRQLGSSECAVGAWGWEFCQGREHRDVHRTRCVESFMSFDCLCGAGFEDMPKPDGNGVLCVDINECERWNPCGDEGRAACHNSEGSYTCETDIEDHCTMEDDYGACFTHKRGRKTISSCVDNLAAYTAAAAAGSHLPELSYCDCEQMSGCWHDGPDGTCEPSCPFEDCMEKLHTCGKSRGLFTWWAALLMAIGLAALLGTVWCMNKIHKRSVHANVNKLLYQYIPLEGSPEDTIGTDVASPRASASVYNNNNTPVDKMEA